MAIKVQAKIVDTQFRLLGLSLVGKAKDFGQLGSETVTRQTPSNELIKMGFSNGEVSVVNGRLVEVPPFRFRNLPTLMYNRGPLQPIKLELTLVARILMDGELKGFDVEIGDSASGNVVKKRLLSKDIMAMNKLYRGSNFVVRHTENTHYIAGRAGFSIEKLPEVKLTSEKEAPKRKATKSVESNPGGKNAVSADYIDGFSAYNFLMEAKNHDCRVLMLPGDKYSRVSEIVATTPKEFVACGIEAADARPVPTTSSTNMNLRFKKFGRVGVEFNGVVRSVPSYTFREKVLFRGRSLNIPRLGLLVDSNDIDWIKNESKMAFQEITDETTINFILVGLDLLNNGKKYTMLVMDTSQFVPMTTADAFEHIKSESELKDIVLALEDAKCVQKYIREKVKACKAVCSSETGTNLPIFGPFQTYSEDALNAIKEAGIDPFTGAFTKKDVETRTDTDIDDNAKMVGFKISYAIKGMTSSPSGKALATNPEKYFSKYPMFARACKGGEAIFNAEPSLELLKKLEKMQEKADEEVTERSRLIWAHNIASYTLTAYRGVAMMDAKNWNEAGKLKNGKTYEYNGTGLLMKIESGNVDIPIEQLKKNK